MHGYKVLDPFEVLHARLLNGDKACGIDFVDPKKLAASGHKPGDILTASEVAAIAKEPMAIIRME